MSKLGLTKGEAQCIAEVVESVNKLKLLKGAPFDIKRDIKNGLAKIKAYAEQL